MSAACTPLIYAARQPACCCPCANPPRVLRSTRSWRHANRSMFFTFSPACSEGQQPAEMKNGPKRPESMEDRIANNQSLPSLGAFYTSTRPLDPVSSTYNQG